MTDDGPPWFYCLRHRKVEGPVGCKAQDRLGPYETREGAEHALEKVKERNEAWKAQDGDS